MRKDEDSRIAYGDNFSHGDYKAEIINPKVGAQSHAWRIQLSDDLFDWIELNRQEFAVGVLKAAQTREGEVITKSGILNLTIAAADSELKVWDEIVHRFAPDRLQAEMQNCIHEIDMIVGPALGLDRDEIELIWNECSTDPFLKRIKPRYPGTVTRKQGFRAKLGSGDRYN